MPDRRKGEEGGNAGLVEAYNPPKQCSAPSEEGDSIVGRGDYCGEEGKGGNFLSCGEGETDGSRGVCHNRGESEMGGGCS